MIDVLFHVGIGMFIVGSGCIVVAMLLFAEPKARGSVFFRGSFQRQEDYSPRGWTLYQAGRALSVAGVLHIVVALMLGGG